MSAYMSATNPEPEDGTIIVVDGGDDGMVVIYRDDAKAKRYGEPDERWFEGLGDADPMSWVAHLRQAVRYYPLGEAVEVTL